MSWFSDMVDRDHDGAMLDDIAGTAGRLRGRLSQVAAGNVPALRPLAAIDLPGGLERAGQEWGDGMSNLLGTRDQSAPNAQAANGIGAQAGSAARTALDPGAVGHAGGILGAVSGGVIGAMGGGLAGPDGAIAGAIAGS